MKGSFGFALTVMMTLTTLLTGCYGPTAKGRRHVSHDDYKVAGYSTKGLVSREYHTVHVPIFRNRTLYRRFEFELTQAVIEMIENRTHLKVVNDPAKADTLLLGDIRDFKQRVLSEDTDDNVQEYQVALVLSIRWINQKTGKDIVNVPRLRETAEAVLVRGENVVTASRETFRDVAERIVEKMESDW